MSRAISLGNEAKSKFELRWLRSVVNLSTIVLRDYLDQDMFCLCFFCDKNFSQ